MILLYRLFLLLYSAAVHVIALWKPKAGAWVRGRQGQWARLSEGIPRREPGQRRFWMHCASLGEFEQGRPVLEAIRAEWPDAVIVLSFFSPSGYEIRNNYEGADHVCYLPMDGPSNARRFVGVADPDAALFVKYEFWHYYLKTLDLRAIPAILVSGAFRQSQPFFKAWGRFFRKILRRFRVLTVQDPASLELLQRIGLGERALISGDTRYDRVLEIAGNPQEVAKARAFREAGPGAIVVAGSTWPEDERMLAAAWRNLERAIGAPVRLIIAPHELGEAHILSIERLFENDYQVARYSWEADRIAEAQVLIIDNMGMLSSLYRYGDIAFIGGGFNAGGIHNVLEPAVFGLPVIMGPVFQKFTEAVELEQAGYAIAVRNGDDFAARAGQLLQTANRDMLTALQSSIRDFVKSRGGATARVMDVLRKAL